MTLTLPDPVMVPAAPALLTTVLSFGTSIAPLLIVKVPLTSKFPEIKIDPAELAKVKLTKLIPEPLFVNDAPEFNVTVVAAAMVKVFVESTVSAPATLKLAFVEEAGVAAMVRPLKTKVPELDIWKEVLLPVTVPEVAVRLAVEPTVKVPLTL